MDVNSIVDNIESMPALEQAAAHVLLSSLGITLDAKPKSARRKITSKLQSYYERVDLVCRTCSHVCTKHYIYEEALSDNQYILHARMILRADFGTNQTLKKQTREMGRIICPHCVKHLSTWSQAELIATLLNLRTGGDYAKITP